MRYIPKQLVSLIVWYLPKCCTSAEDKELIEQARLKLDEAKQSRLKGLDEGRKKLLLLLEVDMGTNSDDLMDLQSIRLPIQSTYQYNKG